MFRLPAELKPGSRGLLPDAFQRFGSTELRLTFAGRYGLKGSDLLPHFGAFAFWAPDFFLFVFRDLHYQGKRLAALFTDEFICRHG